MVFFENVSNKFRNLFVDDNDELLFFILTFLSLFTNSTGNKNTGNLRHYSDDSLLIIFIIAFLFIFFSIDYRDSKLLDNHNSYKSTDNTESIGTNSSKNT